MKNISNIFYVIGIIMSIYILAYTETHKHEDKDVVVTESEGENILEMIDASHRQLEILNETMDSINLVEESLALEKAMKIDNLHKSNYQLELENQQLSYAIQDMYIVDDTIVEIDTIIIDKK